VRRVTYAWSGGGREFSLLVDDDKASARPRASVCVTGGTGKRTLKQSSRLFAEALDYLAVDLERWQQGDTT